MGSPGRKFVGCLIVFMCIFLVIRTSIGINHQPGKRVIGTEEKRKLRDKAVEMFNHAFKAYMDHAYPADELMPLSCKGRYKGSEPSRGDIDDTLGNFTLTLIDALDTLAVLGQVEEFEGAVRNVIRDTRFDADTVVSVFETNIRVLGGLLGGHVAAMIFKRKGLGMLWYKDELLTKAKEIGDRLLPAFNTTTGIPYPRINLKHGITPKLASSIRDTCTSCAGTMILEFAALSRLTGIAVYEEKAHKAMDYLWSQRHRTSDLMGTVINLHNGDWVRRESGVGAGIDSYYEYVLKAYVLLGDNTYFARFIKHYNAVKRYIMQGPLLVDVHMHKPTSTSRNFMDALLAFWPGLQVLVGDIGSAVETHEMLYQVVQRHNFLPEAFTTDFRVHWGQHPLRPEFLESTYFLYEATSDPYYLEVGKMVMNNLEQHARVDCGYAAIKDLKKGTLEDQMDSFVLAETFKYLYLLFSDKEDVLINIDNFVFTTEAHLLPLSLSIGNYSWKAPPQMSPDIYKFDLMSVAEMTKAAEMDANMEEQLYQGSSGETDEEQGTCKNYYAVVEDGHAYVYSLREQLRNLVSKTHPTLKAETPRLKAIDFVAGNKEHLEMLHLMGIRIATMKDGRIQLLHTASDAFSQSYAEAGLKFMQEMIELSKAQKQDNQHEPKYVRLMSAPFDGNTVFRAGPAQFGYELSGNPPIIGQLMVADSIKACGKIENGAEMVGRIGIVERGDCMFVEKARHLQRSGALGGIVIDQSEGTSSDQLSLFAMSGDGTDDVTIPMVFLFQKQGQRLLEMIQDHPEMVVELTCQDLEEEEAETSGAAKEPPLPEAPATPKPISDANRTPSSPPDVQESPSTPQPTPTWTPEPAKLESGFYQKEYLDSTSGRYYLHTGCKYIHINVEVTKRSESDLDEDSRSMKFEPLPDGSHVYTFYLKHKRFANARMDKPVLNEIYLDVIHSLQHQTNLEQLGQASIFMQAIARFLEAAYFQIDRLDRSTVDVMQDLVKNVQFKYLHQKDKVARQEAQDQVGLSSSQGVGGAARQHSKNTITVKTGIDNSYEAVLGQGVEERGDEIVTVAIPKSVGEMPVQQSSQSHFGGRDRQKPETPSHRGESSDSRSIPSLPKDADSLLQPASEKQFVSQTDSSAKIVVQPPQRSEQSQSFQTAESLRTTIQEGNSKSTSSSGGVKGVPMDRDEL